MASDQVGESVDWADDFVSTLSNGPERFLSEAVEHSLKNGRRNPGDFIRHFSPENIMTALDAVPELRARFLTLLVGVRERTALRTPSSDAGRLLKAALEEGDCDPEAIVEVFQPDDRVRYLPARLLWLFLVEGDFWAVSRSKDSSGHKAAQKYLSYWIERGVFHKLHTHKDIVDGISVEALADKLPRAELAKALKRALERGAEKLPYNESDLYGAVPAEVLVDHIPLPVMMDNVVLPLARKLKLLEPPTPPIAVASPRAGDAPAPSLADEASPMGSPPSESGAKPKPEKSESKTAE